MKDIQTTTTTTTNEKESTNPVDISDCDDSSRKSNVVSRKKRILHILLFYLPYFLGIVWTCIHPIVSILTGEMKCRGWYIDEHSIEYKFVNSAWTVPTHLNKVVHPLPKKEQASQNGRTSLCQSLIGMTTGGEKEDERPFDNLHCHEHGDYFSMVTIRPLSGAVDPVQETVVFMVPAPPQTGDWTTSTFHHTLLVSLKHLANPTKTPWLAKTLILVAPNGIHNNNSDDSSSSSSLDETASAFLTAYMGASDIGGYHQKQLGGSVPPLPPKLSGAILRNFVVLQVDDQSTKGVVPNKRAGSVPGMTNFAILPHGRKGVLPNMDLVFLVGKLFTGSVFLSNRKHVPTSTFLVHDYINETQAVSQFLNQHQKRLTEFGPMVTKIWLQNLADMFLFAYTMVHGPYGPHAVALDRGIDAITIKVKFEGLYPRDPAIEMVQYFEYMVRSLTILNERLHHSFTLYLLPSPSTFVSHMEYFLPNILILLPLAIRGFGLVLSDMSDQLDLTLMGVNLLVTLASVVVSIIAMQMIDRNDASARNAWFITQYVVVVMIWKTYLMSRKNNMDDETSPDTESTRRRSIDTLQFVACVLAAYILVPIAFAHTSLSYLPSLLMTPLLAFCRYSHFRSTRWGLILKGFLGIGMVILTAPPILLVPRIFTTYTPFVQFAYIPIHLQLVLLMTSVI